MAETFPIQCHSCTEILDVAADIDAAAPFNCPLCGADIVIAEAVDFDLPCPAAVVIEEQRPERLRFRLRSSLPGSNGQMLRFLFSWALPIHALFLGICIVSVSNGHPATVFEIFTLVALSAFMAFFLESFFRFRSTFIELSGGQLTIEVCLWFMRSQQQRPIDAITCVESRSIKSDLWPFRSHVYYTRVQVGQWGRQFAESSNPDPARFVTHLIRRQLITMGHKLHDG
ncbi:hypothetical protein Pan258_55540 [Symmachiella dynata]|uniref:hypothetical protein n=1 Tax=Symmachiella dynata TaxID=2527995 RepID=UPI00118A7E10|nr:hypothetical protein [Symmachiella dynata]QDT51465.1 hypothetical protein Pan258_55540 [Symmachiella dynata]